MCIITNENNIVVSVSLIPGLGTMPLTYHCYFPVTDNLPKIGDIYIGEDE
jgi:hypothetical protein